MARFLSTVAVWTATALIFIFGVFRFHSEGIGVFLWSMLALGLVWAAVESTEAVWGRKRISRGEEEKGEGATAPIVTDKA